MASRANVELPPNKITVRDGRVIRVERWIMWGRSLWDNHIERRDDGSFEAFLDSPEGGMGTRTGTLARLLAGFHPNVAAGYTELFGLTSADKAAIGGIGRFGSYEIVPIAA